MTLDLFAYDEAGRLVAGVDEVGRGPLAGPVVAAAVILDPDRPIEGLRDSKKLTPAMRTRLAREIRMKSVCFAIGHAGEREVDELNILEASLVAMERAVERLGVEPEHVIVDGNRPPRFEGSKARYSVEARIKGDQSVPSVSAASILAKVCRDRLMRRLDRNYPGYGFASNFGYPTRAHLEGLRRLGPCPVHRLSFGPVREVLNDR
ncbi:MAG TPA: ribonuclease HII [Gammaproteobacteria bacterium]|jgi:ribonuclease HII